MNSFGKAYEKTLYIDYKRCDALQLTDEKKFDISKDVSAFANSDGGTIVYGMVDDKNVPTEIDVGYDPHGKISKEWLDQVISSTIQRRIDGIRIKTVDLPTTRPGGRVLYIISIPKSNRAHMASDHRYYKRFETRSVPMEDYEVWDVAHRGDVPDLRLTFRLIVKQPFEPLTYVTVEANIANTSPEPAHYISIRLLIDKRLRFEKPLDFTEMGIGDFETIEGERVPMTVLQKNWGVPNHMPVWEGLSFPVLDSVVMKLMFTVPNENEQSYFLGWEVRSPKMSLKKGVYSLHSDDGSHFHLSRHPSDHSLAQHHPKKLW